jgi:hypothetical protein
MNDSKISSVNLNEDEYSIKKSEKEKTNIFEEEIISRSREKLGNINISNSNKNINQNNSFLKEKEIEKENLKEKEKENLKEKEKEKTLTNIYDKNYINYLQSK